MSSCRQCQESLVGEVVSGEITFSNGVSPFEMYRYRCSNCRHVFLAYEPMPGICIEGASNPLMSISRYSEGKMSSA